MHSRLWLKCFVIVFAAMALLWTQGCGFLAPPNNNGKQVNPPLPRGPSKFQYPNELQIESQTTKKRNRVLVKFYQMDRGKGWLIFRADENGKPGKILSRAKILSRSGKNLTPTLETPMEVATQSYFVTLHEDLPKDGKFTNDSNSQEDPPAVDKFGKVIQTKITLTFQATTTQRDSPYVFNACESDRYYNRLTNFMVDCRCATNRIVGGKLHMCKRPSTAANIAQFGKGPRIHKLNFVHLRGGFLEPATNEIIAVVDWSDPDHDQPYYEGFVMAFNYKTGDRRIISGTYQDNIKGTHQIGSGPLLRSVRDVKKGTDGKYYVHGGTIGWSHITRVDPKTGKRERIWETTNEMMKMGGPQFGNCPSGRGTTENSRKNTVQVRPFGFTMDKQGWFYLSYSNGNEGEGIIKVSPDGKKCDFVTRHGSHKNNPLYGGKPIGKGPVPQGGEYRGMMFHKDGYMYAINSFQKKIYRIDPKTGDRIIVFDGKGYLQFPQRWLKWNANHDLMWASGYGDKLSVLLFTPQTESSKGLACGKDWGYEDKKIACVHGGALSTKVFGEGDFWFDPDNKDIVYFGHDYRAIVKYELSTGNSYIISL